MKSHSKDVIKKQVYSFSIVIILFFLSCTDSLKNQDAKLGNPEIHSEYCYNFIYPEGEGMLDIFRISIDSGKISSVVGAFPTTEYTFETPTFSQDSLTKYLLNEITSGYETFSDQEYYSASRIAHDLVIYGLSINEIYKYDHDNSYILTTESLNVRFDIDSTRFIRIDGNIDSLGIFSGKLTHVDKVYSYNYSFPFKMVRSYNTKI